MKKMQRAQRKTAGLQIVHRADWETAFLCSRSLLVSLCTVTALRIEPVALRSALRVVAKQLFYESPHL